MKRPVSLSVAEPADTPVVMVAVAADETATIGSVPLPNSARVDEDCGNSRYYFVGNMKHVLHGMVVSSRTRSGPNRPAADIGGDRILENYITS